MNIHTISFVVLSLCILPTRWTQAQPKADAGANNKADSPTITVTKLDINDKTLKLNYEIRNNSQQDIWICDSVDIDTACDFEVYMNKDGQTLMIRKRLDVPSSSIWLAQPSGKYIRLHSGEKSIESLLVTVPVNCVHMYYGSGKRLLRVVNATKLSIEIGYYVGDLPEMFFDMLKKTEKTNIERAASFNVQFGGVLGFNNRNEQLRQRDEEVLIPYTRQIFEGEKVLRTTIGDLSIPYKETIKELRYNPPELTTCTRIEIQYEPSILEYFYPYQSQQGLLSRKEMEYLRSEKTIVVKDSKRINEFANEIKQEEQYAGGIVSENSKANVFCYYDGRRVTSFIVYDDSSIETRQKKRIKYDGGLQSLKALTPQIQPFELRMRCAANLRNLWHRLRFYDRAEKSRVQSYSRIKLDDPNKLDEPNMSDMDRMMDKLNYEFNLFYEAEKKRLADLNSKIKLIYPLPRRWCYALEWSFAGSGTKGKWYESKMKSHVCPSVGEGRSTYAINPNCKYESSPDMVLLFETKEGWNQHGGPELFTFDNHDPKGGCVLLNNGTVKFIRTKEELQQLRWK